jgi:antagonist of KipI
LNIEVINSGIYTTIQDLGRLNGLAYGIPKCGAMDPSLLKYGNSLVGNPISYPALEITLLGGSYKFMNTGYFAIVGNDISLSINGLKKPSNTCLIVKQGDIVKIEKQRSRYSYLVVQGKIEADFYWGSYSTYEFASRGGYNGRKLKKGDVLSVKNIIPHPINQKFPKNRKEIRLHLGPEHNFFSKADINTLVSKKYSVLNNSNRMGYRLKGPSLLSAALKSIISSGVIPGTLQIPSSGNPIILMADSPCTGGYPRIAIVHREDIGLLAQKLPREKVKFVWADG